MSSPTRVVAAALYRRLDVSGHDAARVESVASGYLLDGKAVFEHDHGPVCRHYVVSCDGGWNTLDARLCEFVGARSVDRTIQRDERGWSINGRRIGGVMKTPDGASFGPIWLVCFGVDDVAATAGRLSALGGNVAMEPNDSPDVGRFSFVADPRGARFYIMRGSSDMNSTAFSQMQSGHCNWNELVAIE